MPFHFWSAIFFVFGCVVGSFLNVCIHRMPRDLSIVSPPSHCPHCQYAIPFYLNLPLVTWLMLRGQCRNCRAPISIRYFLVELLTGLAFLACWLQFGAVQPGLALAYSLFLAGLITATFIDLKHYIIPDEITYGGAVAGFALSLFVPALHDTANAGESLARSLLGICLGAGVVYGVLRLGKLLFGRQRVKLPAEARIIFTESALHLPGEIIPYGEIFYRPSDTIILQGRQIELIDRCYGEAEIRLSTASLQIGNDRFVPENVPHLEALCSEVILPREAMGLGDVKFMAAIGAFLGWQGAVFSLMASSVIGAGVGISLILLRHRATSKMPYGPYLAVAAVLWLFARHHLATLLPER